MPNTKVIITKDCFELNGQVAEIVSDYITTNWEQIYIIQTNDNLRITLHEGEFEPLLKLVV